MRGFDWCCLVVQCFIECFFQGLRAGGDVDDVWVELVYLEYVWVLLFDIFGVYVYGVVEIEVRCYDCGGEVMLVGAGFGDDLWFIYVLH